MERKTFISLAIGGLLSVFGVTPFAAKTLFHQAGNKQSSKRSDGNNNNPSYSYFAG